MKVLLFLLSLISALYSAQEDLTPTQISAAQKAIKASGYTCDTVDGQPFFSDTYTIEISCNNKYRYLIKDRGGRLIVMIK